MAKQPQRQNSVEQMFTGFVNLFRAEYAPDIVTVDERRFLEVMTKSEDAVKAVQWIEEQYKGQAMIWTLLPNLEEALLDVQGDCTVRDISIYLDRAPVLSDILSFCTSTQSWIEGEPGNICILLYTADIKTVRWSSLLSCSYLLFFGLCSSAGSAIKDLHSQRTMYHRRDKKRTPAMTHQHLVYLLYIERLLQPDLGGVFAPICIREVVMRGIPRCAVAPTQPAGCIPLLAIRNGASGEFLFQSSPDRHYSPEDGAVRWALPTAVCYGDLILSIHHCQKVGVEVPFFESKQGGEPLVEVSLHSAMLALHNSAPSKSATTYMHPFACCLKTVAGTHCVCLDRHTLGIAQKDTRFRLDFHVELLLADDPPPPDSSPIAAAIQTLKEFSDHLPARQPAASSAALHKRGSAVGARGLLKVTPNPKEVLREFRSSASKANDSFASEDDALKENVNSVGVRFSFPPRRDPFSGEIEASLAAEEGSSEELVELPGGGWGLPVQGFCMVLSLLVVLEPLESDPNAQKTGNWKKCRVRIPIEKIMKMECKEGRLELEWDTGDARGKQSVVVDDHGLAKRVDDLAAKIKGNMLRNVQAVRALGPGSAASLVKEEEEEEEEAEAPLDLDHESKVLDLAMAKKLRRELPYRFRSYSKWDLLFSTELHGSSVGTFFNRTGWRSPTLLLVMDEKRTVFGAFCSAPWEMHYSYFGTGESFVWKVDGQRLQVYRWGMANEMFQLAHKKDGISVGGGKCHAIWLDAAFENGSSGPCETFNSPGLSASGDEKPWRVLFMEAWGLMF